MQYLDCRLTVKQDAQTKEPVVEYRVMTAGFQPVTAPVCHDPLTKLSVERLNRWIGTHGATCEREDLRALGLHLYHILFKGALRGDPQKTVAQVFEQTYREFCDNLEKPDAPELRMRLTLVFEATADDLAAYPWEFLFVPTSDTNGFFLTGERRELILTRAVSPSVVSKFDPERTVLNILIAVSKPKELQKPDETVQEEIERLAKEIEKQEATKRTIKVHRVVNPTQEQLLGNVNHFKPHIVHLIGHGRPGQLALCKTEEQMALEHEQVQEQRKPAVEEADWVDGNSVRAIFNTNPPRIVFLHACSSAKSPGSLASFKSLAQQVLNAKVPAVVAMQYEISNDDATRFATKFYQKLGEGLSIDEAVAEGRNSLAEIKPAWGHPRFGTPVVYLQSDALPIFKRPPEAGDGQGPGRDRQLEGTVDIGLVPCPYECGNSIKPTVTRCVCVKRQPLKACPKCRLPVPKPDPDCQSCGFTFEPESPAASVAGPSAEASSAAVTTGPRLLTR